MSDGLSQSDLDALFAGLGDTGTAEAEKKTDVKQEMSDGLSQSDLDALFAGFGDMGSDPPAPEAKPALKIDMSAAWEAPPEASEDKGEVLSQDDIDKLLAMYGS